MEAFNQQRHADDPEAARRSASWRRAGPAQHAQGPQQHDAGSIQVAHAPQVAEHRQRPDPAQDGQQNRVVVSRISASASLGDLRQPPHLNFSAYWRKSERVASDRFAEVPATSHRSPEVHPATSHRSPEVHLVDVTVHAPPRSATSTELSTSSSTVYGSLASVPDAAVRPEVEIEHKEAFEEVSDGEVLAPAPVTSSFDFLASSNIDPTRVVQPLLPVQPHALAASADAAQHVQPQPNAAATDPQPSGSAQPVQVLPDVQAHPDVQTTDGTVPVEAQKTSDQVTDTLEVQVEADDGQDVVVEVQPAVEVQGVVDVQDAGAGAADAAVATAEQGAVDVEVAVGGALEATVEVTADQPTVDVGAVAAPLQGIATTAHHAQPTLPIPTAAGTSRIRKSLARSNADHDTSSESESDDAAAPTPPKKRRAMRRKKKYQKRKSPYVMSEEEPSSTDEDHSFPTRFSPRNAKGYRY